MQETLILTPWQRNVAGRNVLNKGHKSPQRAGLVSFCSLSPACWRISPVPEFHSHGLQEQNSLWSQGRGRNLGVPSQGRQGTSLSWVPGDQGYAGSLAGEQQRPAGRARAGAQAGLASAITWHLEPQQSLGVSAASQSPEQCPCGGRFRRAMVREHGSEAWLLEWGHMHLVVLRALRKLL